MVKKELESVTEGKQTHLKGFILGNGHDYYSSLSLIKSRTVCCFSLEADWFVVPWFSPFTLLTIRDTMVSFPRPHPPPSFPKNIGCLEVAYISFWGKGICFSGKQSENKKWLKYTLIQTFWNFPTSPTGCFASGKRKSGRRQKMSID